MACAICGVRKPRRHCPGVSGDICSVCCGTEREVTVSCPLDCLHLREARAHERRPEDAPHEPFPERDVRITEAFLHESQDLLVAAGQAVFGAAMDTEGAVDRDVRDAFDALIRTYRTLQSGVYYETRPDNLVAARLVGFVQDALRRFREGEKERLGMSKTRDADVLGILVFLERVAITHQNTRPRGRAFLDFLRSSFRVPESSPLIVS